MKRALHNFGGSAVTVGVAAILVASGLTTLFALRQNNARMLELRQTVIDADATGHAVYESLAALQSHVTSHMNATPPKLGSEPSIQLKATYDRAKAIEDANVSAARNAVAAEAARQCESGSAGQLLSVTASCVANYTAAHPINERRIVPDLYRYDFVSPRWSADLAGWALLVTVGSGLILAARIVSRFVAKATLQ